MAQPSPISHDIRLFRAPHSDLEASTSVRVETEQTLQLRAGNLPFAHQRLQSGTREVAARRSERSPKQVGKTDRDISRTSGSPQMEVEST